jgi:protein TonB
MPLAVVRLPVPEVAEPEIAMPQPDVVPVISVVRSEATALPEMTAALMPRLAGLNRISAELPGLPVAPPGRADLLAAPSPAAPGVQRPFSLSQVDRAPRRSAGALPRMPQWARRAGLEGTVSLRFIVTAEGDVTEITVSHIEGDERFGPDAIRTAMTWRFEPATRAGRPVPLWCFQKVNYTLED